MFGHMLRGISFHGAPTPELDYGRGTHKSSRMAASSSVSGSVDSLLRAVAVVVVLLLLHGDYRLQNLTAIGVNATGVAGVVTPNI